MPALPNVPQVFRFTLIQQLGSDLNVVNRFYQKQGGVAPISSTDMTTLANGVATEWNGHIGPISSPDLKLLQVQVQDLTSPTGAVATINSTVIGSSSNPPVTAGVAFIIQEKIPRRYRGGHPRQYLAGIPQAAVATEQTWNATQVAIIVAAYTAFRAALSSHYPAGLQPSSDVSVSFFSGFHNVTFPSGRIRPVPTLRGVPLVDQIASFAGNPKFGSQRRRNRQSA